MAAMEVPFPELTDLGFSTRHKTEPVPLPDSFLGGSAPRLQFLYLDGIPFPGLPKLLLSATHLTHLLLFNIPHSGYISPEAMVTSLSILTSLDELSLEFQSPLSRPDRESRVRLPRHALSSPLSHIFRSKGSANTWRISWPASMPLDSTS